MRFRISYLHRWVRAASPKRWEFPTASENVPHTRNAPRYRASLAGSDVRMAYCRRSDPSIKIADVVANPWGFWHLGQFAADFRRQFGELPSQYRRAGVASGRGPRLERRK